MQTVACGAGQHQCLRHGGAKAEIANGLVEKSMPNIPGPVAAMRVVEPRRGRACKCEEGLAGCGIRAMPALPMLLSTLPVDWLRRCAGLAGIK